MLEKFSKYYKLSKKDRKLYEEFSFKKKINDRLLQIAMKSHKETAYELILEETALWKKFANKYDFDLNFGYTLAIIDDEGVIVSTSEYELLKDLPDED